MVSIFCPLPLKVGILLPVFLFLSSKFLWRIQKPVELVRAQNFRPRESSCWLFYWFCFQRDVSAPVLQICNWRLYPLRSPQLLTAREAKGCEGLSHRCQSFIFYISSFVEVEQQQGFLVSVCTWSLTTENGLYMYFVLKAGWGLENWVTVEKPMLGVKSHVHCSYFIAALLQLSSFNGQAVNALHVFIYTQSQMRTNGHELVALFSTESRNSEHWTQVSRD